MAQNIEAEVKKIGQNSRGLKTRRDTDGTDYYGMIRLTDAPAVICEGVFVDNATDVKIADTVEEQRAFGYAYARGILKTLGIADNRLPGASGSVATTDSFKVKVTITVLYIRKGPGTNYGKKGFIKPGVYTIVATQNGWGKLKKRRRLDLPCLCCENLGGVNGLVARYFTDVRHRRSDIYNTSDNR